MTGIWRWTLAAVVAGLMLTTVVVPAMSEEQTVDAFSVWEAHGHIYKTGNDRGTFVGSLEGIMFVQTPEGPINAGKIVCPGMLEVNLKDGSQAGEGRCVITGEKGLQVFAKWSCAGYHLVGCKGQFVLNGGTEKFAKVTGGGPFVVRTTNREVFFSADGSSTEEAAVGIAFWKGLRYELP